LQQFLRASKVESAGVVKAGIPLIVGAVKEKVKCGSVVHGQSIEWEKRFLMICNYIIGANLSQVAESGLLYYT
jgi:hypothetical protein